VAKKPKSPAGNEPFDDDKEAKEINTLHERAEASRLKSKKDNIAVARRLSRVKNHVGHGRWLPWVREHLKFGPRQAQYYLAHLDQKEDRLKAPDAHLEAEQEMLTAALKVKEAADPKKTETTATGDQGDAGNQTAPPESAPAAEGKAPAPEGQAPQPAQVETSQQPAPTHSPLAPALPNATPRLLAEQMVGEIVNHLLPKMDPKERVTFIPWAQQTLASGNNLAHHAEPKTAKESAADKEQAGLFDGAQAGEEQPLGDDEGEVVARGENGLAKYLKFGHGEVVAVLKANNLYSEEYENNQRVYRQRRADKVKQLVEADREARKGNVG
jgi:hypothetical protein